MAKGDYYFPLFYHRLLTSTIGWKDEEFGAYLRLLIYQFDNGSIPSDLADLSRISPSIKKHWPLISKKFKDNGKGGLINEVMNDVYNDIQEKKIINTENGKKGGRPKKKPELTKTETKPNGFKNETETKPILINNNQETIREREAAPPAQNGNEIFFSIEHCLVVALNDDRWVKANKTSEKELQEFNALLEKRGVYQKNPADYKTHFANWKRTGKKDSAVKEEPFQPQGPKLQVL